MLTRRHFLESAALAPIALRSAATSRLRLAAIANGYAPGSAAQQLCDRFLVGYPWDGDWRTPDIAITAIYAHQKAGDDLTAERSLQFGFKTYSTIAETLRSGGSKLGCDAVLLAVDERDSQMVGQLFQECAATFKATGAKVPVFVAYGLGQNFERAQAMIRTAEQMRFPLAAGSWLPLTFRLPDQELPLNAEIEEALIAGGGGPPGMQLQAFDCLQATIERRAGGEHGIEWVQYLEGESVWKAGAAGEWSRQLLSSALSRSDTPLGLTLEDGRTQDLVGSDVLPSLAKNPAAFLIRYRDGARATLLFLNGAVRDYNFAARLKGGQALSWQFLISPDPNDTYTTGLTRTIEAFFTTRKAPWPIQRSLLTSGLIEAGLSSQASGSKKIETPHLSVTYQPHI